MRPAAGSALPPYLAGAGAIACWATLAAAIGQSLRGSPPEAVLFWGLLAAGLALLAWEGLRGGRGGLRDALAWPGWTVALYGVYGIWGYHTLLVLALAHAPQLEANVLNYTWPLWIVLLGGLLPGHRFTGRLLAGGLLGFAGVALVIGGGAWLEGRARTDFALTGAWADFTLTDIWQGFALTEIWPGFALTEIWQGFALALAASLVWSTFTVFLRRIVPGQRRLMALFCLLSAIAALGFAVARGVPLALPLASAPLVAYLGLVPLGASFVLWEFAAQRAQMQVLGLMSFFTPPLSTALLALSSGTAPGAPLYAGLALVLAGTWLGGRGLRRAQNGGPAAPPPGS